MKSWIVPFAVATLATGCIIVPAAHKKADDDGGAVAAADGGAKAAADADGGVVCTVPQPGDAGFCQASTNLTAQQVTNQTSLCISQQGTVLAATACPEGAVGCCATTSGSVAFDQCFYASSATAAEMQCETMGGIWTPGLETGDATGDAGATD